MLAEEIRKARRVYLIGNGGSAANASHIANDLVLSCGVRAHALLDVPTFSAAANDYGYAEGFLRQVAVYCEPGDLLVALSGSGRSENVLRALRRARGIGARTLAIFGEWSEIEEDCADIILRQGRDMQAAEEAQLELGHEAMRALKK